MDIMIQGPAPLNSIINFRFTRFLPQLIWAIALLCAYWVIYNVSTRHKHWDSKKKLTWIICAILFNIITAIVYYFVEYKKR
jgi:prolipoprotein diacylglyceryltransferase